MRLPAREELAPWAGGFAGPAAWYAEQQGLGALTYYQCAAANPLTVLLVGLVAAALVVGSGVWSLGVWREGEAPPALNLRRFVALLSVLAAGVFTLAIVYQTLAGLLIPGCAR